LPLYPIPKEEKVYIFHNISIRMRIKKLAKQLNVLRAGFSYLSSILIHKPFIAGMPLSAGIEITNYCNLKCPECSSGSDKMTRARGLMKTELFEKFISEAGPYLFNINLYFQGEPMLHPQFFSFIEKSADLKVTVSTNGHFLTEDNCFKLANSGIDKLIVSLDGMDRETYSRYRVDGNIEKVLAGLRIVSKGLSKYKSSVKLEIQFLVNRYNEFQIPTVKQFANELEASLKLKSMQIIHPKEIEQWMPVNEKFRRYVKNENGMFTLKSSYNNNCFRLWKNPVITWDGKVIPCCFDKDAEHIMGDLNESSFREIWHGEKFREFRRSVLKRRRTIDICRNCTSGLNGVAV
jgi:radical SAM protein with 4Fe4S-binding SPASM domain